MTTKGQVNETTVSLPDSAMDPRISVVGVGGAGCNVVSALYDKELHGLELVAINSDEESLTRSRADVKVLLDLPKQGRFGVDEAEISAEAAKAALERALDAEVLFLVAGMGGKTGTNVAPVIAEMAGGKNALVISIAVMPFAFESRMHEASEGLQRLKERSHTCLVVDNNNLLNLEELGFNEAMTVVNSMVSTLIGSVMERLTHPFVSTLADEVQLAASTYSGTDAEPEEIELAEPAGVEAEDDMKPVGFDDRGFIGFA
jgi:cell division protein FtsZ